MERKKIVVVGEKGVGKTNWIGRLRQQEFEENYIGTMGTVISPMVWQNRMFSLCDMSGHQKFYDANEGNYAHADGGIIMLSSEMTMEKAMNSIDHYKEKIVEYNGEIPIIVVINKCDIQTPIWYEEIKNHYEVVKCSAKMNNNVRRVLNKVMENM